MLKINTKEIIEYWEKTAKHSYDTMNGLFKLKRYSDSLFFGHLVLEKILKAHVIKKTKKQVPHTHDLTKLIELAQLKINYEEKDVIDTANHFNIRCRYPDIKLNFYKQYNNFKIAKNKLEKIKKLYKKLCQQLK